MSLHGEDAGSKLTKAQNLGVTIITEKEFEEYRRKYIANIFQNFNLINSYTVYQNVELILLLNGYKKSQVKDKILKIIVKSKDKLGKFTSEHKKK